MSEEKVARVRTRARDILSNEGIANVIAPKGVSKFAGLDSLVAESSKSMGVGTIRRASALPGFTHIGTGIFTLDMALLGGVPEGLVSMILGWEASGKTTTAMRIAANAQHKYTDKAVVYIDTEQTYDAHWAASHGVDNERVYVVQPESGEQAVDILDAVLRNHETCLVVLDSLPALVPFKESEDSAEDLHMAKRSQLIARACSKTLACLSYARKNNNKVTLVMINQWRTKVGISFGDPRIIPGGVQPKFLCTTIIETKTKKEHLGKDDNGNELVTHNDHEFTIKKSKVGNSLRTGAYQLIRDPGHYLGAGAIDEASTVVTYAKRMGIITGGGASWHLDGVDKKFGRLMEVQEYLEDNLEEYANLKVRIVGSRRVDMGLSPMPNDGYMMGVRG